ncbi:MAG: sigma-70 family RNA polymerase sigma factor [Novosphingobium sp.]|nr:sigma-70 family RNA polymerase sigma factor [Novosphingobium sp.]
MAETAITTLSEPEFKRELAGVLPHLRAFARGLCGRVDYADDLVQEAAIRAWRARERFEAGTNFRAWTFTILRNHYLSELRKNSRQTDVDDEVVEHLLVMQPDQEAVVHLADMESALTQLSEDRREAILLVGASGFTYEEAAEICGCAVGTVKSRVARARTDLARLLGEEAR